MNETRATGQEEEPLVRFEESQGQDVGIGAQALEEDLPPFPVTHEDLLLSAGDTGDQYFPLQTGYRNHDLPCDSQELTAARQFIELFYLDFCQSKMSEQSLFQLEIAVHEVVANIIRHAYPSGTPGRIQLEAFALESEVRVLIVDYGMPYPHQEAVLLPAFDGTREHGFGLFLVREGVDKQERFRDDTGRNILMLTKRYDRTAVGA